MDENRWVVFCKKGRAHELQMELSASGQYLRKRGEWNVRDIVVGVCGRLCVGYGGSIILLVME